MPKSRKRKRSKPRRTPQGRRTLRPGECLDVDPRHVDELFDDLLRGGLPFDKGRPVLLVCPVGEKSRRYAALLARMGHTDARSLDGGVVAWRDAGAPLVRS